MVRLIARRHGVSESLLYNWRSARKAAAIAAGAPQDVGFVPVGPVEGSPRCWHGPRAPNMRSNFRGFSGFGASASPLGGIARGPAPNGVGHGCPPQIL